TRRCCRCFGSPIATTNDSWISCDGIIAISISGRTGRSECRPRIAGTVGTPSPPSPASPPFQRGGWSKFARWPPSERGRRRRRRRGGSHSPRNPRLHSRSAVLKQLHHKIPNQQVLCLRDELPIRPAAVIADAVLASFP